MRKSFYADHKKEEEKENEENEENFSICIISDCRNFSVKRLLKWRHGAGAKEKVVRIGVTGTDGNAWEIVKEKAEKEGIKVKLIEFSDYTTPNKALADGDIELNSFQHVAFLEQFKKSIS